MVAPVIVWAAAPLNVTVPELCVNVPEFAKLPDIDNVAAGAVNVPAVSVKLVVSSESDAVQLPAALLNLIS